MRPLVPLLAFCALLALAACQAGPGPSSALDLQPGVGGGARLFADRQEGVGCAARIDLGRYRFQTGRAAEPVPLAPGVAPLGAQDPPCAGGACRPGDGLPAAPEAPTLGDGGRP